MRKYLTYGTVHSALGFIVTIFGGVTGSVHVVVIGAIWSASGLVLSRIDLLHDRMDRRFKELEKVVIAVSIFKDSNLTPAQQQALFEEALRNEHLHTR